MMSTGLTMVSALFSLDPSFQPLVWELFLRNMNSGGEDIGLLLEHPASLAPES